MISAGLDALVERIAPLISVPVTRDIAKCFPPCVFVDAPSITGRTMSGVLVSVPLIVIMRQPADLTTVDDLAALTMEVLDAVGESEAETGPFTPDPSKPELNYPAMTVTAVLLIEQE